MVNCSLPSLYLVEILHMVKGLKNYVSHSIKINNTVGLKIYLSRNLNKGILTMHIGRVQATYVIEKRGAIIDFWRQEEGSGQ